MPAPFSYGFMEYAYNAVHSTYIAFSSLNKLIFVDLLDITNYVIFYKTGLG